MVRIAAQVGECMDQARFSFRMRVRALNGLSISSLGEYGNIRGGTPAPLPCKQWHTSELEDD